MNNMDGRDSQQETRNKTSDYSEDNRKEERETMNNTNESEMTEKQMKIENKGMVVGTPQRENNGRRNMNNTKCNTPVSVGDGLWLTNKDDNDLRLEAEATLGKTRIIFNEQCCASAWHGIDSKAEEYGFARHVADNASEALARYERIMWLYRPWLLAGEAKVIVYAMNGVALQLSDMTVGLKNDVYISVGDIEMEYPDLYQECGADRSILLAKVNAMTTIEIFSLLHSAEAFSSGDLSDESLEKYFNITSSKDSNVETLSGCDKQEVNP
mgnify:CR=1 FL=1